MTQPCTYDERLLDYLYEEMGAEDARLFAAHVEGCAQCQRHLGRLRGVRTAFHRLPAVAAEGTLERLTARILSQAAPDYVNDNGTLAALPSGRTPDPESAGDDQPVFRQLAGTGHDDAGNEGDSQSDSAPRRQRIALLARPPARPPSQPPIEPRGEPPAQPPGQPPAGEAAEPQRLPIEPPGEPPGMGKLLPWRRRWPQRALFHPATGILATAAMALILVVGRGIKSGSHDIVADVHDTWTAAREAPVPVGPAVAPLVEKSPIGTPAIPQVPQVTGKTATATPSLEWLAKADQAAGDSLKKGVKDQGPAYLVKSAKKEAHTQSSGSERLAVAKPRHAQPPPGYGDMPKMVPPAPAAPQAQAAPTTPAPTEPVRDTRKPGPSRAALADATRKAEIQDESAGYAPAPANDPGSAGNVQAPASGPASAGYATAPPTSPPAAGYAQAPQASPASGYAPPPPSKSVGIGASSLSAAGQDGQVQPVAELANFRQLAQRGHCQEASRALDQIAQRYPAFVVSAQDQDLLRSTCPTGRVAHQSPAVVSKKAKKAKAVKASDSVPAF